MYSKDQVSGNAPTSSHALDQWMLNRLHQSQAYITEQLEQFNTVKAGRELQDLITELSTWFVRRSRDRIKAGDQDSQVALQTLGYVLVEITKLMAPFMPFLSEHLFKDLTGQESVHLEKWTEVKKFDESVLKDMAKLRQLVELGLALRKEHNIKVRQPLAEFHYMAGDTKLDQALEQIIAEELNVKKVSSVGEILQRAAWVNKADNGLQVSLNTELTKELQAEGLARELERQVQDLRKKSGLKVGELVDLYYNTTDEELSEILVNQLDRKKTFVSQIKTSLEVEADFETQATVEGKAIWLGLVRL